MKSPEFSIDEALRELPLQKPEKSVWDEIAQQLEAREERVVRRNRWWWGVAAAAVVILNAGLFVWQSHKEELQQVASGDRGEVYSSRSLYSAEEALLEEALLREIGHLEQLIPAAEQDDQIKMQELLNQLRFRLVRVVYQVPDNEIRL